MRFKNIFKSRAGIAGIALFLLFAGLSYYLFISDNFRIKNVEVRGVNEKLKSDIIDHYNTIVANKKWKFIHQNNIFLFPEGGFKAGINYVVPKVKNVNTETRPPHKLLITAEEREQKGIWCNYHPDLNTPECYFYDTEGVIYAEAPNSARGFLIVPVRDKRAKSPRLGDKVLNAGDMEFVDTLREALGQVYKKPDYISFESENEARAGFSEGWEAYFNRQNDLIESVENLILVLEEEIKTPDSLQYIDLRLGTKVFYKYKNTGDEEN